MAPSIRNEETRATLTERTGPIEKPPLRTVWPPLLLEDRPMDDIKLLRAIVVGGGISGILASILLPRKVPGIDLTVYERDTDLGGVWHSNKYPGVRCDVPSHAYQATFAPNPNWSEAYAKGDEIKQYWDRVATQYDAKKYIRFQHKVVSAEWSESKSKWLVAIDTPEKHFVDEANFLITATGHFSDPRLPSYPGQSEYQGHMRHSSNYDRSFDPTGKRIAVIGNGASGIQILPQLQKSAVHIDHYARNPTWVAAPLGGEDLADFVARNIEQARKSPESYLKFRKELDAKLFSRFGSSVKGGSQNVVAKDTITQLMSKRLNGRPDLLEATVPDFDPNCRRLTPGPGYLEALTAANVSYISTPIRNFTKTGIITQDGVHREVDAVICSTGHDISFSTAFPIFNKHKKDLQEAWRPGGNPGFPDTYLGLAAAEYPNLLLTLGPNSTGLAGTVPHSVENQLTYFAKILRKVSSQGIRSLQPSAAAVRDFRAYCESYFPCTVMSENCSSWYNGGIKGGRIHGLWPGSAAHVDLVRREPRWEDFEYTHWNEQGNRFAYFGNGWTKRDVAVASGPDGASVDLTPWLKLEAFDGKVDLTTYLEGWWEYRGDLKVEEKDDQATTIKAKL